MIGRETSHRAFPYAVAVAASAAGIGLKLLLGPAIVPSAFLTSYPAVIFSAWYGGLGPGLLATGVSAVVGSYLFLPPEPMSAVREVLFVGIAALLSVATALLTARQRRLLGERTRELEQVNATLRESEERFHQAFESAATGMALMTLEGVVVQVNHALCEILMYERHDLLGRLADDIVHPGDRTASRRDLERLLNGEIRSYQTERRLLRQDGHPVWAQVGVSLLRDAGGHARYVVTQLQDITRRKRAEDEVRASEARFRTLAETVAAAIFIYKGTQLCYVNPQAEAITGYSRSELLDMAFWEIIDPTFRELVRQRGMARQRGESIDNRYEVLIRRKDGTTRWVDFTGARFEFEGGQAVLGTAFDITEQKLVQQAVREREADLAHMLRLTTMNEMAAGLAHEINQPLSAIVNYAKGCVRRLDSQGRSDDEVRQAIDRIGEEALRAGEVIRRLRHLIRKEPPRREAADLNSLVQEALRFVDNEARDLAVHLDVELSTLPVPVLADTVQIEQVILNLVRNGLDAIRDAGGDRRTLSIRTRQVDGSAEVEVRDTGHGLPEPDRDRIFEPFFTTKSEGLGMGLSISRSIVETHGGYLRAMANEGGGACVSFTLPLQNGPESYVQQ